MKLNFINRAIAYVLPEAMTFIGSNVGDVITAKDVVKKASSSIYNEDFSKQTDPTNALHMSKVATRVGDGVDAPYNISLGAYTTGIVETVTEGVPTDIVLVLDQSGSMNQEYSREYYNGFTTNNGGIESVVDEIVCDNNYYQYENGVKYTWIYKEKKIGEEHWSWKYPWHWYDPSYGCWDKSDSANNFIGTVEMEIDRNSFSSNVGEMETKSISRSDALKKTAKVFVEGVSQDATTNNVDHRITIVGFANDACKDGFKDENNQWYDTPDDTVYHNSFFYSNKNKLNYVYRSVGAYEDAYMNAKTDKSSLISAINGLQPKGATAADLGFNMAESIIANNNITTRNKVVLFISDGECSSVGGRTKESIERDTINKANSIKTTYNGKIYSISVNPSGTSRTFLENVSSGEGYYLEANNSSELNNIFETISHDISSPGISLENGELRDTVSDYFQAPLRGDITVKTAKFTGGTVTNPTFAASQPLVNPQIVITDKNIVVKGFNYDSEYLRIVDGQYYGSKLMVSFNVNRVNGFIGGNNVPTNRSNSGIYAGGTLIESFAEPKVNVPLKYDFNTNNGAVYITKNLNDPTTLFSGLEYQLNGSKVLGDPITNDFAKVTYIIEDNGAEVGRYTIAAGANSIIPILNILNTKGLNEDHSYQIKARVEPSQLLPAGQTVNEITTGGKTSTIFVYKPTITAKDSTVFLGDTTDMEENILPEITWKASNGAVALETTAEQPTLTFNNYVVEGTPMNPAGTLTPQKMTKLKVKVNAAGDATRDITDQTKIISTDGNGGHDYNFKVDVVTGTIIIEKEIPLGSGVEEGNPIFTFKIENGTQVFYRTVRFGQNVAGIKRAEAITGLPKGKYTITELNTLRYHYNGSSVLGSETTAPTLNDTVNKSVKVAIGQTSAENSGYSAGIVDYMTAKSATIRFNNGRETKLGRPTDTDVVTNRFVIGSKVEQIETANTVQP